VAINLILIALLFLLVFVVGIGTLVRVFSSMLSGLRRSRSSRERFSSRDGRFGKEEKIECMLACSVCGVHVPESEGIKVAGEFFCCEAHRK